VRWLNNMTKAFADVISSYQEKGRNQGVDAMANAGVLVTMIANVAAHHYGFEFWGIRTADVRVALARHIYWGITGQSPPSQ
jgi:hypothetical protein